MTLMFLIALPLALAAQAPDFAVSSKIEKGMRFFTATPPAGHHFNIQAPMALDKAKPSKASERLVEFKVKASAPAKAITLFLCDDAKSFCEKHVVSIDGAAVSASSTEPKITKPLKAKKDEHGFWNNAPDAALNEARATHKPLLIDFYGIWCPPCNMLNVEVFPTKEFKEASKKFVLLKLDADAPASWDLKSKFKVSGYPTIILSDSNNEEISRFLGSRSLKDFLKEMNSAYASRDLSFHNLFKAADAGDRKARDRLGSIFLERKEYRLALQYLEDSKEMAEKYQAAKIGMNENEATLQEAIEKFPDSVATLEYRSRLAEIAAEKKDKSKQMILLEDNIHFAEKFIKIPATLEGLEYTKADLWQLIADARETLGQTEPAKKAWAAAAAEYAEQIKALSPEAREFERGNNLERAYCLHKAGDSAAAESIYSKLEKKYPGEFTFYFAHAKMFTRDNLFDKAEPLAQKAFDLSYGDNRLRAAHLLATVLDAKKKRSEALNALRSVIKSTALPKDQSIRTHKYYENLVALEKKLSSTN